MFARTFAIKPKGVNLSDAPEVVSLIGDTILREIRGRRALRATLFADVDHKLGKIVFYDVSAANQVMEFSSIFGRFPAYAVTITEDSVKIHHYHGEAAVAKVLLLSTKKTGSGLVVEDARVGEEESRAETESLRVVTSTTEGFIEAASEIAGTVVCNAVENEETGERLAFFTLKIDAKSQKNRAIIRSAQEILFAWSDVTSYMIFICRFRMLPPFAVSFPLMGRNIVEAMDLYTRSQKGVGMVMFTDDVSDTFSLEKGKPAFE